MLLWAKRCGQNYLSCDILPAPKRVRLRRGLPKSHLWDFAASREPPGGQPPQPAPPSVQRLYTYPQCKFCCLLLPLVRTVHLENPVRLCRDVRELPNFGYLGVYRSAMYIIIHQSCFDQYISDVIIHPLSRYTFGATSSGT